MAEGVFVKITVGGLFFVFFSEETTMESDSSSDVVSTDFIVSCLIILSLTAAVA